MSARYYGSPTLRLRIGKSRLRARLLLAFSLLVVTALWALAQRGYPGLACLMGPPLAIVLWALRAYRDEGVEFGWWQGSWYLLRAGKAIRVEPARRAIVTPWLMRLLLQGAAGSRPVAVLVFVDSVPARDWRRLRARLTLQGG